MLNPVLDSALCASAEIAINSVLKYDLAARQALAGFNDKTLRIQSSDWLILTISFNDSGIALSLQNEDEADATIYGTLAQFSNLALAQDKADALMNGDLDISGNSALVLDLAHIAQNLDIDWEAMISPATGGVIAHALGKGMRSLFAWGKDTSSTMGTASKQYLEEETDMLVPKPLMENFSQQVSELRLATDRAEARLKLLQQKLAKD